jgi:hypothetical protein
MKEKHISVLLCINATWNVFLTSTSTKKEMRKFYIHECKTRVCMTMQPNVWTTTFFVQQVAFGHFIKSVQAMGD